MDAADLAARLRTALSGEADRTSDFDLNPDIVLPPDRVLRRAGVLVPFLCDGGAVRVILTVRSSALRHHPGQIAFPGGRVDPGDDGPVGAALREAREEIGLDPGRVEVIGSLAGHETVTGFDVTPVLAIVRGDFRPVAEEGEVAEVFSVPFEHVSDVANFSVQARRWRGRMRHYYTVPWGPYYIWGATARMLRQLAARLAS